MIRTELEDVGVGAGAVEEDDFGFHLEGWILFSRGSDDRVYCCDRWQVVVVLTLSDGFGRSPTTRTEFQVVG